MKLILNGGGSGEQIKESYALFKSLVGVGKVLYLPFAWLGEYSGCLDWFSGEMELANIKNFEMATKASDLTKEKLSSVKALFIGGGNTYKLLKELKTTCAYENIKQFMSRDDSVIMGGSAGALIFGKDIDTCLADGLDISCCNDVNAVNLLGTSGFNCIKNFSILPHYHKKETQYADSEKRVQKLIAKGYNLICLPEESSIFISDGKFKIIGSKPAVIRQNGRNEVVADEFEI